MTQLTSEYSSKVFIVGAGPGDAELLTLKAARLIQQADAILYDKLVNPEILDLASDQCELIYVGKEAGKPCRSQSEINEMLVEVARRQEKVVRLKGGDPFIFGRGGEEGLFLREHGIDFEIVPGVSSSVAAPAYAGIPLTHRKVACSYAVITGHESPDKDESQIHWDSLVKIETLVFMMSVGNRKEIAERLIQVGRPANDPVAFIENGTSARQKIVFSTLQELVEKAVAVASPAVMVIGPVVNLSDRLQWFSPEEPEFVSVSTAAMTRQNPQPFSLVQ